MQSVPSVSSHKLTSGVRAHNHDETTPYIGLLLSSQQTRHDGHTRCVEDRAYSDSVSASASADRPLLQFSEYDQKANADFWSLRPVLVTKRLLEICMVPLLDRAQPHIHCG